jgi:hypothetical protein
MITETLYNWRGNTRNRLIGFVLEECCNCGIPFLFPQSYYDQRQMDGKGFSCPNGHEQHYSKTKEQKLREEMEEKERHHQEEIKHLTGQSETWRDMWQNKVKENKTLKQQKTRMKNRIAAGVCPCCDRTFQNLARHMASKHSEAVKNNPLHKKINEKKS